MTRATAASSHVSAPFRRSLALSTALGVTLGVLAAPAQAQNTPSGPAPQGAVNGGVAFQRENGTIYANNNQVNGNATTLNVLVTQPKSIINWQKFDITDGSTVNFKVVTNLGVNITGGSYAVLNRVTTGDISQIAGNLTAPSNLAVWLINPNGIMIGSTANISVGSLVASTLNTTDADFMGNGAVNLKGSTGAIFNNGAPGSIRTTNGVLALIAEQINLSANTNSGANATAFVMASDVDIDTSVGGPLSIRVNAGTLVGSQSVKGAIVGDRVYALMTAADGINALLDMGGATVTNATQTPAGVVILGSSARDTGHGADLTSGRNTTGSSSFTLGSVDLSSANATSGDVVVLSRANPIAGGAITAGSIKTANAIQFEAVSGGSPLGGAIKVTGNIGAGSINLIGGNIKLGDGATPVTAVAAGNVALTTLAGPVTIDNGVSLTANNSNASAGFMRIGGAGTTALLTSGSTLRVGQNGNGALLLQTITSGGQLELGNVTAGTITGQVGTGGTTPGVITRTGAISASSLTLSGANSFGTDGTLTVGPGGTGAIAIGNNLILRGGAGVEVRGPITSIGNTAGDFTAIGNSVALASTTLAGDLRVTAGLGGATFGALGGNGDKAITSGKGISGGTITGTGAVTLTAAGGNPLSVTGAIGSTATKVASLTVDGGAVSLQSAFVTGTTAIGQSRRVDSALVGGTVDTGTLVSDSTGSTVLGAVRSRTGGVDVESSGAGVTFNGTVDGPGSLNVGVGGTGNVATFLGEVGATVPFATFATSIGTAVRLDGGSLTTTGAQSYGATLVLGRATTITGSTATFRGINGAGGGVDHDLQLNFSGQQGVGGLSGIRDLTTGAGGGTTLNGAITTSGAQSYGDAVTLTGATTLTSTGAAADGNNHAITFGGTLSGGNALSVITPGTLTFIGAVGATPLSSIDASRANLVSIKAPTVTTTGDQSYGTANLDGAGDVTLNAGNGLVGFVAVNGPRGLTVNTTGTTTIASGGTPLAFLTTDAGGTTVLGGTVRTVGTQTYGDAVSLSGNTVLTGGLAVFGSTVAGNAHDLTINTSGAQRLGSEITGVNNLVTDATGSAGSLTLTGSINTTGDQRYGDAAVVVAGDVTLTAGTNKQIAFAGTLDGDTETRNLTLTAAQTSFGGDVGTTSGGRLASLTVNGATAVTGPAARTIRTVGTQTFNGGVALGSDLTLIGTGASFGGGVIGDAGAPHGLTLTFSDASTLPAAGFSNLGSLLVNGAGVTTINGPVSTIGGQSYLSDLVLGGPVTLTSTGAGAIALTKVSGAQALFVNTGGVTSFNGALTGVASITTDAPGSTLLNVDVETGGAQDYGDDVVLGANVVLGSTDGSPLRFGGTVSGAHALTVNTTGITTFDGSVGSFGSTGKISVSSPTALTSSGTGAVVINGGAITTMGAQTYVGQLRLGADTQLAGSTGSFGDGIVGNGHDLAFNFSGDATVTGGLISDVGAFSSGGGAGTTPGGPNTNGTGSASAPGGLTRLAGTISSTGGQTYYGNVLLVGKTTLRSGDGTDTGAITFNGKVDGTQALRVTTAGATVFNGAVGTTPLASIVVDGTGGVQFNGGAVSTTGLQSYAGAATLGGQTFLSTDGGDIQFGQTVDGPYLLSVRTGANAITGGNVVFGGAVGGGTALTGLAIRADAASIASGRVGTLAAAINTGGLSYRDGAGLTVGTVDGLTGIDAGADAVDLGAAGLLSLQAGVTGGTVALNGLGIGQAAGTTVNAGAGTLSLDGQGHAIGLAGSLVTSNTGAGAIRLVHATDVQLGDITTGAGGTLVLGTVGAGAITGAVAQASGTVITAGVLTGAVGGTATLLNTNNIGALGAFAGNGLSLRNAGDLRVTGPVDAGGGDVTLATDTGSLMLSGDLIAGNGTVSLSSGEAITQGGGGIAARALNAIATGAISLTSTSNAFATLGTLSGGGVVAVRDGIAMTLGADVAGGGSLALTAPGIVFTGRTLTVPGAVTLDGLAGDVVGGTISGSRVTVSGGGVSLDAATATAGALAITTTDAARMLTLGTGSASTAATVSAAGGLSVVQALTATGDVTTGSVGATRIASVTSTGGNVGVTGASVDVVNAAASGALLLRGLGGVVALGTGTAGGSATLAAGDTLDVTGSLTSTGDVALGTAGMARLNSVESTGGAVSVTAASLAATRVTALTALDLRTTGALSLGTGTAGGAAMLAAGDTLDVTGSLTSAGDAALSATGMARLNSVESTGGAVSVAAASLTATRVAALTALDLRTTVGNLALGSGVAGGTAGLVAAGDVTLGDLGTTATPIGGGLSITAGGGVSGGTAVATGAATLVAGGPITLALLNGATVSASGRSIDLAEGNAAGALSLRATGGTLTLGTGVAGGAADLSATGDLSVLTRLTGGNGATLTTGGDARLNRVVATAGDVTVTAAGAVGGIDGGRADLAATGPGGLVKISAGTGVVLGPVQGDALSLTAPVIDLASATGSSLMLNATAGSLTLGSATIGGAVSLLAKTTLSVASIDAGGAVSATAGGLATIGSVTGTTVAVTGERAGVGTAIATTGALLLRATGGDLTLGTGRAAGGATLEAIGGALAVTDAVTAVRDVALSATGATTAAAVSSTAGAVSIAGGSVAVGDVAARSTLALSALAGDAMASTASAGGDATIRATGGVTLGSFVGAGNVTGIAGGDLTGTSVRTAGAASLTAANAVRVDTVTGGGVLVAGRSVEVATAVSGSTLMLNATGGALSLGTGTATGAATLSATGPLTVVTSLTGGGNVTATATGAATVANIGSTAGDVAVSGASTNVMDATAGRALALTSTGGALSLGTGTAGTTVTLSAAGPLTVVTSLTGGGNVAATATGAATVATIGSSTGDVAVWGASTSVTDATAGRALALTTTGGALSLGTGTAGTTATLSATGPLTVVTSLTGGGNVAVTATGAATVTDVRSMNEDVAVSGANISVTSATAGRALALTSTGGALSLGNGTAGTTATLSAAGPLTVATSLTGAGAVRTSAAGATAIAAIISTGSTVGIAGTAVTVATARAAGTLDLLASAGDLTLGTGAAGNAATLKSSGALGVTGLTTGGTATLTAGTTLNSGTLTATGAATLTATGAATLGATSSGAAVAITGGSITAGQTNAATGLTLTSAGALSLSGGQAGGDAMVDAGGLATLGAVTAGGGNAITVKAGDAAIGGTLRAGTVRFVNRAAGTAALRVGNNTSAGGFTLDAAEVNRVEAGQLTLDGGAGDVQLGTVAFGAPAGATRVDVLSTGRIDVTGAVSGTGAGRTFRLGGTAAEPATQASVIRVVATADAGGRLLFDTADVDLRGARIGVGQASGFLNPLGFGDATGQPATAVVGGYVTNPNSSLYNAAFGGTPYPVGTTLLVANSLTVRYTDYALFQNTGEPGKTAGIVLGTIAAGPKPGALTIQGPNNGGNGFAFFGTIGGLGGDAASVLGPSVVVVNGTDIANTRINGCVVGSAAGCLSAVVTQPLLSVFDSSRTVVFRAGDDLVVPFDPVVGSSNEALFAGLGLPDEPVAQTPCLADPGGPACGPVQEPAK